MADTARADSRFAVYLLPPYQVARPVTEIHQLLRKQFGFLAAARFQVHVTIKNFFRKTEGPLGPLIERLDAVFARQHPFPLHFCGVRLGPTGISLDVSCLGEGPNPESLC